MESGEPLLLALTQPFMRVPLASAGVPPALHCSSMAQVMSVVCVVPVASERLDRVPAFPEALFQFVCNTTPAESELLRLPLVRPLPKLMPMEVARSWGVRRARRAREWKMALIELL